MTGTIIRLFFICLPVPLVAIGLFTDYWWSAMLATMASGYQIGYTVRDLLGSSGEDSV